MLILDQYQHNTSAHRSATTTMSWAYLTTPRLGFHSITPTVLESFMNDHDRYFSARNAILLLSALCFDPSRAVEVILHLWWSALIPGRNTTATNLGQPSRKCFIIAFDDECAKLISKPAGISQSETRTFNSRSPTLNLLKDLGSFVQATFHPTNVWKLSLDSKFANEHGTRTVRYHWKFLSY